MRVALCERLNPVHETHFLTSARPGFRIAAMCVLLCAGTALLFGRALDCEFVNFDDPAYITDNLQVQGGLTWSGVVWAFTAPTDYWHPLTWLSHMIDWDVFSDSAVGHHLTSAIWHALNAALAFLVFLRLAGGFWRSAFAAALFAWHPLRVESVVWVTERKDVMSGFFFLLSLLAYVHFANARAAGRPAWSRYLLVVACFAAGLMSKPMLVTLPLVLLLLDFWPLRRATSLAAWRPLVFEKLPLFAMSAVVAVATVLMQRSYGAFVVDHPTGMRIGNAVVSVARYLGKFAWPADLSVCYPHPGGWPVLAVTAASALVAGLIALGWWQRAARPWIGVGVGWFLVSLLPVVGLFQVGFQAMADRFTYVPILGVGFALTWSLPQWRLRAQQVAAATAALLLLAACAWRTWEQQIIWKDSVSLFSYAVRVDDRSDVAHDFLASALFAVGRFAEAGDHAERARSLNPGNDRVLVTLAALAEQRGALDEAVELYRESLALRPENPQVQCQLGLLELGRGNTEVARTLMTAALRTSRQLVERTLDIARQALVLGQSNKALLLYEFVLAGTPDQPDAHAGVGFVLLAGNDAAGAIDHLLAAASQLPGRADVQLALAGCAQKLGKTDVAAAALERAIRAAGDDAVTLSAAAELHARRREFAAAARIYEKVVDLAPGDSGAHAALGYMLILQGHRAAAISAWKRALEIEPEFPGLRERLHQMEKE
jgi:tetratricopeptide (TPR) repeat protein